jgi:integrase
MVRRATDTIGQYGLMRCADGWFAYWYVSGDTKSRRKRARLGLPQSTPVGEARAVFKLWVRARTAALAQDQKMTIGAVMDAYIADRRKEGKNATKMEFQWRSLRETFAALQPADLKTPIEVAGEQRTICHKYALEREGLGRARDTIHSELSLLRTAMAWGHRHGLIPEAAPVWVSSPGTARRTALTEEMAIALLGAIVEASHHIRLLILIAFATGARKQAILDLKWERVDLGGRSINFNTGEKRSILNTSHQKGRAVVDIEDGLLMALTHAKEFATTEYVIEYRGRAPLKDPKEGIHDVFVRAGLTGRFLGLHALRHTLATWAADRGVDMRKIQLMLGHDRIETTEQIYVEVRRGFLREVAGVADAHIRLLSGHKSRL